MQWIRVVMGVFDWRARGVVLGERACNGNQKLFRAETAKRDLLAFSTGQENGLCTGLTQKVGLVLGSRATASRGIRSESLFTEPAWVDVKAEWISVLVRGLDHGFGAEQVSKTHEKDSDKVIV
jgi:hypothetical protein